MDKNKLRDLYAKSVFLEVMNTKTDQLTDATEFSRLITTLPTLNDLITSHLMAQNHAKYDLIFNTTNLHLVRDAITYCKENGIFVIYDHPPFILKGKDDKMEVVLKFLTEEDAIAVKLRFEGDE